MPTTKHVERHFTAGDTIKDIVIGMSDGLTVPFALAAGLSGATADLNLIVIGGLAEVAAGAIAMGLGGYLAAKSDREHYLNEKRREEQEIIEKPEQEKREVEEIFKAYGLKGNDISPLLAKFQANPQAWVDFMMRFELGIEEPSPNRARASAVTIGFSYIVGGIIPLIPYMVMSDVNSALIFSAVLTLITLAIFGFIKSQYTGVQPMIGAVQTLIVGGLAASAAFIIAKLISYQR